MSDPRLFSLEDDELEAASADGAQRVAERRAFEASRPALEKDAFRRGLKHTMDLWYAHAGTTVVLLTTLPPGVTRDYHSRGWCTFERCSAELAKSFKLLSAKWNLVIDMADEKGGAARRLPTTPERMEVVLASRQFTSGDDKDQVLVLYRRMAKAILPCSSRLGYQGLAVVREDEWSSPIRLGEALNYCSELLELDLAGMRLDDECMRDLAQTLHADALPRLKNLYLSSNRFGADGIAALCGAFERGACAQLRSLHVEACHMGEPGVRAFASAIRSGQLPSELEKLDLMFNCINNRASQVLAAALLESGSTLTPIVVQNEIGLDGMSAVLGALEAAHGLQFAHVFTVILFNQPFWPRCFTRSWARGYRASSESCWLVV